MCNVTKCLVACTYHSKKILLHLLALKKTAFFNNDYIRLEALLEGHIKNEGSHGHWKNP